MSARRPERRRAFMLALAVVVVLLAAAALPRFAIAAPYTVLACDAAPGGQSQSWVAQAGSIDSYKACPSSSLPNGFGGMGTRLAGRTFANGEYSRLWFYAPTGTTITRLTWGGRFTRTSCAYAVQLRALGGTADQLLVGRNQGGTDCNIDVRPPIVSDFSIPVGTTQLLENTQCAAASCPSSGAAFRTYYAAVTLNDPTPPGLSITGGGLSGASGWVRGTQSLSVSAGDVTGIRLVRMQISGSAAATDGVKPCNYASTTPCTAGNGATTLSFPTDRVADGAHTVTVTAYDAASNVTSRSATARIDNHAPAAADPSVDGGSSWRRANSYALRWASPEAASPDRAPITRLRYRVCVAGSQAECWPERSLSASYPTSVSAVQVPGAGEWDLRLALVDSAGNGAGSDAHWSGPARLRYDPDPPSLRIEPQDASDPLEVSVRASDAASGIADGQIEVRRSGTRTWLELPTRFEGGRLLAMIDDERLPDGRYDVRARASDRAGNESSTAPSAASRRLPVRIATRLRAGFPKAARKRVRLRGKRRSIRRRVVRLLPRKRVRRGRRFVIRGNLATRDGQPLEDTAITVLARPDRLGGEEIPVGLVRTDRNGRFRYRARAGESRVLRFAYRGTRRVRGTSDSVHLRVPARVSFAVAPRDVVNGEAIAFAGHVSGLIPPGGKQVVIQAHSRGRWRLVTFLRTDGHGRYSGGYRFDGTRGKVVYPLRALVTREATFAYAAGASRTIKVTVRGL